MEEGEGGVCEGETRLSAERYSHKLGGSQSCQPKSGGEKKKRKSADSGGPFREEEIARRICAPAKSEGEKKKKRHRADRGSQFREKKISAASFPPAWVAGGRAWMV